MMGQDTGIRLALCTTLRKQVSHLNTCSAIYTHTDANTATPTWDALHINVRRQSRMGGDSTIVDPITPRTTIKKTLADKDEITSAPPSDTALRPFKTVLKQGPLHSILHKQLDVLDACAAGLQTTKDTGWLSGWHRHAHRLGRRLLTWTQWRKILLTSC